MKYVVAVAVSLCFGLTSPTFAADSKPKTAGKEIAASTVNLEAKLVDGKKTWTPATATAPKGNVVFHLTNTFPEPHGFNIPGVLKEPVVVLPNSSLDVPVKFEKPGTYDVVCHMHPAHVKSVLTIK